MDQPPPSSSTAVETVQFDALLGVTEHKRSTDDVLAATLPLLRQVAEAHERGLVAPLAGTDALRAVRGRLFFENARCQSPERAPAKIEKIEHEERLALEIVARSRAVESDAGLSVEDLSIVDRGGDITRPVHLPGFVSWEHEVGHHDPVTDVYVLGLIVASLAIDQSLGDKETLAFFVARRRDVRAFNDRIHPVVARIVEGMTSPRRRDRLQDLRVVIEALEHHRDQEVHDDLNDDVLRAAAAGRRALVCQRLRGRLFDLSRRNRLLYFHPSAQSLDLTEVSVPLTLDVNNVAADALMTCTPRVVAELASMAPLALSRWVRFEDYPFAPAALDKLRTTAARARSELGFSSLKLALCFLHWHDLKKDQNERIHTPLLLLPVELVRKKGVRDAHILQATSDTAEVNPVLRHVLEQTYGLRLPDTVDLSAEGSIDALHRTLVEQIQATEPAVVVDRIERPAIELIHTRVRRRLDAFRKRATLSGRGVRAREGIEYSYRRDNFQPLGLRLFTMRVMPSEAPSASIFEGARPRMNRIVAEPEVREIERETYRRQRGGDAGGPYRWGFDLTSMTLGNFDYQKISLVRDYDTLLTEDVENAAFDALFSIDARPAPETVAPPPLAEQFPVVATDATQTATVSRARKGTSFIVQGPPGTGKSQTITNLIADYVARGQRVLFVCEKRAAIDVVYHRLRQLGLDRLTTLIHDSQADKKSFVASLKESYDGWMANAAPAPDERRPKLDALVGVTSELERFDALMTAAPANAASPLVSLLRRSFELPRIEPALPPHAIELLPPHRDLTLARAEVDHVARVLVSLGESPILALHPARLLDDRALRAERPIDHVTRALSRVTPALDRVRGSQALIVDGRALAIIPAVERASLAATIRPLAAARLLALLDDAHDRYRSLKRQLATITGKARNAADAAAKAAAWKSPISRSDLEPVFALARAWQGKLWRFLFPSFWRLRGIVRQRFDFAASLVPPTYVDALALLAARYDAEDAFAKERQLIAAELGVDDLDATTALIEAFHARTEWTAAERDLRRELQGPSAPTLVEALAAASPALNDLKRELDGLFAGYEALTLEDLGRELSALGAKVGAVPELAHPLVALRERAPSVAHALCELPLTPEALERAVCDKTIEEALRGQPSAQSIHGRAMADFHTRLDSAHAAFRRANAGHILQTTRARFLDHVRVASAPASTLDRDDKSFKRDYAAGRRDLEHELGKVMRFKAIRELMTGKTGLVIRDLKPVWLMSPLSVADTLPLSTEYFDVVVFDEASQIPLEDALPAIHRAKQCIVVGDEKQLPPTNFFGSTSDSEDEAAVTFEERGERVSFELDADSLLAHAARTLPSTMLGWHYRSRDEALIQFSNQAFYEGKLATIPTPTRAVSRPEIRAKDAAQGADGARLLMERSLSFHRLEGAVYDQRTNRFEAEYIAEMVRGLLAAKTGHSIGIVAFSEAQQDEIEGALRRLAESDAEFRAALDAEMERTEDDQFCGLFVKNLENVQGDERDIIVLSICYGPDAAGKMRMNFGPINKRGGEKRLNVIFSRARRHLAVVSSIDDVHITNDYNDGANTLRCYLRYAAAVSRGDEADARTALRTVSRADARDRNGEGDATVRAVAEALRAEGFEVDESVGGSSFRCDLAVRRKGEAAYRLAVLIDTDAHYAAPSDERHRVKPSLLRAFGWRLETVLAKDWRESSTEVIERLRRAIADDAGVAEG